MPHSLRARAVHRGRAQRLAVQGAPEEQRERTDQRKAGADDEQALHAHVHRADGERRGRERRRARALGAEEPQAEAEHREVQRDRDDEEHQHARFRQRLVRDAIDQRAQRRDARHRQHHLHGKRQRHRREEPQERRDGERHAGPQRECARECVAPRARAPHSTTPSRPRATPCRRRDPRCPAPCRAAGWRASSVPHATSSPDGTKITRVTVNTRTSASASKRVDRAVGDAVLRQQCGNREVHGRK